MFLSFRQSFVLILAKLNSSRRSGFYPEAGIVSLVVSERGGQLLSKPKSWDGTLYTATLIYIVNMPAELVIAAAGF